MRRLLVVLSVLAMCVALSAQQGIPADATKATGKIAGRIVAADSGKPIRFPLVHLVRWDGPRGAQQYRRADAQGHFEFAELIAGQYELSAEAEGYVTLQFGQRLPPESGKRIDLKDAEIFDKADITLPPTSAIEGTLLDEFGDPAPNVLIQLSRLQFVAGRHRLMPVGGQNITRTTDDKGQFRIYGLAAGDYYVSALSGAFSDQNESGGFAPTFFPGTSDPNAARPVHVGYGDNATGLAFPLIPAATVRVAGTVVDATGQPVTRGTVVLAPSDRTGTSVFNMARGGTDPGGGFAFRNVPPGVYTLQAFGPSPTGALGQSAFGYLPVTIDGHELTGLTVRLAPDTTLRGRITFEGDATMRPTPPQVIVSAGPVSFDSSPVVGGGPPRSIVHDDYTFEVGNMSGLRIIRAAVSAPPSPNAPAWTLKRITLAGKDVTDATVDFTRGDVDGLEIVLTSQVSSVTGTVTNADGTPSTNYSVIVFAVDTAKWTFPSRFVQLARPNQGGGFTIQGLPPETYLAVAVTTVQGTEWQDPDFLESLRPRATFVTVGEGDRHTVALKLPAR